MNQNWSFLGVRGVNLKKNLRGRGIDIFWINTVTKCSFKVLYLKILYWHDLIISKKRLIQSK